jgi:hypothetical protein
MPMLNQSMSVKWREERVGQARHHDEQGEDHARQFRDEQVGDRPMLLMTSSSAVPGSVVTLVEQHELRHRRGRTGAIACHVGVLDARTSPTRRRSSR